MQTLLDDPKTTNITPLPPAEDESDYTNAREELDAVKATLRILNLEDNTKDAELNEAMLSARWPECELLRVETREDFIAALEQEDLDLVLSDYTMPDFNGLEALALARERRPDVPFLFVSGTIGEDTAIEALKNGATDYVLKHRLMRLIPAADRALREIAERVEREHAEHALRESEHKYRVLFESLSEAAFLADDETGKIIDANPRAGEMLGLERGEILGRDELDFLALDVAEADSATPVDCELIRADGGRTRVSIHNTWLALHGHNLVLRLCRDMPAK